MIAVIASNRSANPLKKSTLIVAPLALLDQWQAEIEDKTDLGLKSLIYHGSSEGLVILEVNQLIPDNQATIKSGLLSNSGNTT